MRSSSSVQGDIFLEGLRRPFHMSLHCRAFFPFTKMAMSFQQYPFPRRPIESKRAIVSKRELICSFVHLHLIFKASPCDTNLLFVFGNFFGSSNKRYEDFFSRHTVFKRGMTYLASNYETKFGPLPCPLSPSSLLCIQFAVVVCLLFLVRPPFVCRKDGSVRGNTVLALSFLSVAFSLVCSKRNLTPFDVFKGVVDATRS